MGCVNMHFCNYIIIELFLLTPSYSGAGSIFYASDLTQLGLNRVLLNRYKCVQSSMKAKRREGLTACKKMGLWEWFREMAFELVQNKTDAQISTSIYSPLWDTFSVNSYHLLSIYYVPFINAVFLIFQVLTIYAPFTQKGSDAQRGKITHAKSHNSQGVESEF